MSQKPFQHMLCAVLNTTGPMAAAQSAAALLLSARVVECMAALLRWLQHAPDEARVKVLGEIRAAIADCEVSFARTKERALLAEIVRTVDWAQHAWNPTREVSAALSALRAAVMDRQHARDASDTVMPRYGPSARGSTGLSGKRL